MIVINKRRIQIIVSCILISLFAFSIQMTNGNRSSITKEKNENINTIETTSTPVSGKIVVLDAGHGIPDEGEYLLHKKIY